MAGAIGGTTLPTSSPSLASGVDASQSRVVESLATNGAVPAGTKSNNTAVTKVGVGGRLFTQAETVTGGFFAANWSSKARPEPGVVQ